MHKKLTGLLILAAATIQPLAFSQTASPPDSTATAPAAPLQGGVERVNVSLDTLQNVGLDLKQLLKGADSLYDEVTIQPVTILTEPEVVGRGMVINIPIGTMPAGPRRPPSKSRVDLAMGQIRPVIEMMKTDVDAFQDGHKKLDLPQTTLQELQPQMQKWMTDVTDMSTNLTQLEVLTKGPSYDSDAIAQVAQEIQKDAKDLDKSRRDIYKVIKKEGKRISAFQASEKN